MNEHFIRTKHKVLELLDSQEKGAKLIREYIKYLEGHIKVLEKTNSGYKNLLDGLAGTNLSITGVSGGKK